MSKKNDRKNEGKKFSTDYQPSSKAKSNGWERRRLAKEFMDKVFEMQDMTIGDFEKMEKAMGKSKQKFTMRDLMAKNYIRNMVNSDKLMLDWLDRHIGKPPKFDEKSEEENRNKYDKVIVEIINTHKTWDENGNIVDVPKDSERLN
ncbi:MAG: hypothetical protein ACOCXP_02425 [Candidatus Dojkabacteria bacterium]